MNIEITKGDFKNWITGSHTIASTILSKINELANDTVPYKGMLFNPYNARPAWLDQKDDSEQCIYWHKQEYNFESELSRRAVDYFKEYYTKSLNLAYKQGLPVDKKLDYLAFIINKKALLLTNTTNYDSSYWNLTILNSLVSENSNIITKKEHLNLTLHEYTHLTDLVLEQFINNAPLEKLTEHLNIAKGIKEKQHLLYLLEELQKDKSLSNPIIQQYQNFLIKCLDSSSPIYVLDHPEIVMHMNSGKNTLAKYKIPMSITELGYKLSTHKDTRLEPLQRSEHGYGKLPEMYFIESPTKSNKNKDIPLSNKHNYYTFKPNELSLCERKEKFQQLAKSILVKNTDDILVPDTNLSI